MSTFWLFAQILLNVIPAIQGSLGLKATVANFAISVTALMSGLVIVVLGGVAERGGDVAGSSSSGSRCRSLARCSSCSLWPRTGADRDDDDGRQDRAGTHSA